MDHPVVSAVREFVDAEVRPTAAALEHADAYPHELVARMRELGLFGALVPADYGGLGLDVRTYARVIEELCRGWMSLAGVINSHTMAALIVLHHGTDAQRRRFLPRFARGEARGGLALTEPHAGTDVQAIRTVATRRGDDYVVTGTKLFITNGREGNTLALLALTDPKAEPRHRGMSCFIVEKGHPGFRVVKSIAKLGYKGVDTAELVFDECVVPAANLVGGIEGRGFKHVMGGLEAGRINIAARAVGVAQAAYDDTLAHHSASGAAASPALAEMATKLRAARLLTGWAAAMKDRGERCDLEAGMAKLFASESAQEVAVEALRLHGGAGSLAALNVERYYRDTPLMIIGEGTNEIQRTIIARSLLERYGERFGALTSRDGESEDTRQMVLAVRQFVDKRVVPAAQDLDLARAHPAALVAGLAELGILGALVDPRYGGLGLDARTAAMIVEELARGSATLAAIVMAHLTVTHAIGRAGTAEQRERLLPPMTRGELLGATALGRDVRATRAGSDWILDGETPPVDHAARASVALVEADSPDGPAWLLVEPTMPGVRVGPPEATLGLRGLEPCRIGFDRCRVPAANLLGGAGARAADILPAILAAARLGVAAAGVGLAQAAFEAALRYSQQRTTFGKPIAQHQAIQLALAGMATKITAARLLVYDAAAAGGDDPRLLGAKVYASEVAYEVTLDSMRVHGGYGYTSEFPVERYYRDAARLASSPTTNAADRAELARRLSAREPGAPRGADRLAPSS
jgi:alkylation response protein AidB-like acyl-CoA dehydrogenase